MGLRSIARVFIKCLNQIFNGNKSTAQMQYKCDFGVSHPLIKSFTVVDSNRPSCYFGIAYRIWLKHYLNVFTQPPSGAISMHIHLHSFYVFTNGSCSDKTVRMRRVLWAFSVCVCDIYHNLMSWLVSIPMLKLVTIKLFLGLCVCAYVWWSTRR